MRGQTKPITPARVEHALDRLAVIIDEDPEIAEILLPMFRVLEEELNKMRAQETDLDRIRARARQVREA
jgi:hypothetical protein